MNKILIVLSLLALGAFATHVDTEELRSLWSSWKTYHGRDYATAEESARFAIFVENYKKVIKHNAVHDKVKLGLNRFADITSQEFKAIYASGYKNTGNIEKHDDGVNYKLMDLPDSVDWRDKGAVTPVKDQGQCGSCWSFSTTGVLEGWYFLNNGKLLSFSEQQIVDCDKTDDGCNGGLPYQALDYTAQKGLELEGDYPYKAKDALCKFRKGKAVNVNSAYTMVTTQSVDALKTALVAGPVSIAIEADEDAFQLYSSGVITENCGDSLDHAVLAVGYTTVGNDEAFIVKNSWNTSWGDQGYVYISTDGSANDGNGVCGILAQPVIPK